MVALLLPLLLATPAHAKPAGPGLFCDSYPDAPVCATGSVSCVMCHSEGGPPSFNPYGEAVRDALPEAGDYELDLPGALAAIEDLDSDGDGASNLEEIQSGNWPGFTEQIEQECLPQVGDGNSWYRVGQYDPHFAFKRITHDFCGRSPRYDELQALDARLAALGWRRGDTRGGTPFGYSDARDDDDVVDLLQDQLTACLRSPYWQDVVWEIGVGVVQPKGYNSDLYILGNYDWDLRLFAYATTGDRDAADLMEAQYLVVEEPSGSGVLVAIDEPRNETEEYAQPLAAEDRFGLITTRHSLAMNVMFSAVPRTLASHWYRELLGLDMSLSEGLFPIDEAAGAYDWAAPRDVDEKGVWQEGCASCHTTLDPLSYPWARYNGIDLEDGTTGMYLPDRATDVLPTTEGAIFGADISTPTEWVEAAVASDAFSARVTELFWQYIFRRAPFTCEAPEYEALWQGFRDGAYDRTDATMPRNVEEMLHELVLTNAYGTP